MITGILTGETSPPLVAGCRGRDDSAGRPTLEARIWLECSHATRVEREAARIQSRTEQAGHPWLPTYKERS